MTDKPYDPYAFYRSDEDLETNGILLEEPNMRIRIARAGGANSRFQTTYERVMRPLRRAIQLGTLSEDVSLRTTAQILAESIILSWETRKAPGSDEWVPMVFDPQLRDFVEPTPANIQKALIAAPALCSYVFAQAKDETLFREEIEEDLKN